MTSACLEIGVPAEGMTLGATLTSPATPRGLVLLPYGSASGRWCGRDEPLTRALGKAGFATLLIDLLTEREERIDSRITFLKLDVPLLARRLIAATAWASSEPATEALRTGYFGTGTAAAAALEAAARLGDRIGAVVSRGGHPDLADPFLPLVRSPTLLIVGARDRPVLERNRRAYARLRVVRRLEIVPGTGQIFEEREAQDAAIRLTCEWFSQYLPREGTPPRGWRRRGFVRR